MFLKSFIAAAALIGASSIDVEAKTRLLFVLDSSNSMWGQVDGVAKMETAKTALSRLMTDLPQDTDTGLMVYGHRDKSSCEDVELVLPLGKADPAAVNAALEGLSPTGKTPIAYALGEAASAFTAGDAGNSVVLISDGVETCNGDPCAAAGALAESNVDVRVHVVGFDISDEDRAALECIAEQGKGRYFAANSTQGFSDAVSEAVVVAQAEPEIVVAQAQPEPAPEPSSELYFEDEFDGEDVSEDWSIINPDPDRYIVEEGEILMVNSGTQGFASSDIPNIIMLDKPLPKGDWDLTADLRLEMQTGRDSLWFGLYKDASNYLAVQFFSWGLDHCSRIFLRLQRMSKGEVTNFDSRAAGSDTCGYGGDSIPAVVQTLSEDGARLTLSKRGRTYTASIVMKGLVEGGDPRSITTEALTSLRVPGKPAFAVGLWEETGGEVLTFIERVEIVSVKK